MRVSRVLCAVSALAACVAMARAQKAEKCWGKPDREVSIRATGEKRSWNAGEEPRIVIDLSLGKVKDIAVPRMPATEIEVDGLWYVSRLEQPVAGYIEMHGANVWEKWASARLDGNWTLRPVGYRRGQITREMTNAAPLKVAAGKHTIRVKCLVDGREPISNPVDIKVAAK